MDKYYRVPVQRQEFEHESYLMYVRVDDIIRVLRVYDAAKQVAIGVDVSIKVECKARLTDVWGEEEYPIDASVIDMGKNSLVVTSWIGPPWFRERTEESEVNSVFIACSSEGPFSFTKIEELISVDEDQILIPPKEL